MAAVWDIFWCKVFFKEYIKHYRKMTDEQIVKDVRQSMDDLEDLVSDTDTFGSQMVRWANERADEPFATAARENGKKGGRPRKKKETTADAPTSDDGEFKSDSGDAGNLESATSANIYGVATHREAGDVSATDSNISQDASTGNGEDESLVHPAPNMRRVPQNEAPAHGFSGGRTAQGTMSRSPEAAAQSGKDYDQETAKTRDTREDSHGRYAPPSCSPDDGNPAETAPSHGGSVASLEARQGQALESQRRTGAPVRGAKSSTAPVRSRASFRNKEEFIQWAIDDGLDPVDANECWEATEERGGKDADGNTVKNMKAFARQWCRTRKDNRRTA